MLNDFNLFSNLLNWFLFYLPMAYFRLAVNSPKALADMFGLEVQVQYFFVPMFRDTSWVGRMLSLFFRIAILFGGTLIVLVVVAILWLGLPLLLIGLPIAGFYFRHWLIWVWWVLFLGIVVWRIFDQTHPWKGLDEEFNEVSVLRSLPIYLSRLANNYPANLVYWANDPMVQYWCSRLELDVNDFRQALDKPSDVVLSKSIFLREIFNISKSLNIVYPEIGEVMGALFETDDRLKALIKSKNISLDQVKKLNLWFRRISNWTDSYSIWDERYDVKKLAGVNRALTASPTPVLNMFSFDMTMNASKLPYAVDREESRNEVLKILSKEGNKHVMIVGETGTGKTTFVGGLAQTIMEGGAPEQIANKRLVKLEPGRLVAGATTQGALTERLVAILEEIERSGDIILFIDEIHTMMTEQLGTSGLNLFTVMEEFLFKRKIQVMGVTSVDNYKKYIEPNEAFVRLFEVVELKEPNENSILEILENIVLSLERKHGVLYSLQAIEAAISLSNKYIHDRKLPDKAKSLLDDAGSEARESGYVTSHIVAKVLTRLTGVPVMSVGKDEKVKLLNLEKELHKEYVNQELAVKALADALRRGRLKVGDKDRPVGVFMFVGPTGVGKTELAMRLSEVYFGSEKAIVRVNMGEFGEESSISRLIGAAPGEVGYGEGGELTEKVRRQPSSLLLLDEIEKAHFKVWNLLLQLVDEGKLNDASGLEVDFTNTIIIATSNAATTFISQELNAGRTLKEMKNGIFNELLKTFRIEFLNRFDGIIPFGPLDEKDMEKVVEIQLKKLKKRLLEKNVEVNFTKGLIVSLAKMGTDVRLGARPLRRLVQDKIESRLAIILLKEQENNEKLNITLDESVLDD